MHKTTYVLKNTRVLCEIPAISQAEMLRDARKPFARASRTHCPAKQYNRKQKHRNQNDW